MCKLISYKFLRINACAAVKGSFLNKVGYLCLFNQDLQQGRVILFHQEVKMLGYLSKMQLSRI